MMIIIIVIIIIIIINNLYSNKFKKDYNNQKRGDKNMSRKILCI